jgi:serine/threonine protein kinase/formylglycine-generating enzyme required for sulfatase activity
MGDDAKSLELPPELLEALFRVLYGPTESRERQLAALRAAHPDFDRAISAQVASADAAAASACLETVDLGQSGRRGRQWSLGPGTTFGAYRIGEHLGTGGMGAVFAATRLSDGAPVALKVLHADALAQPAAIQRFEREARALAALRHPNLCELFEGGEVEGCPFLAMRLVDGPTLAERIAAAKRSKEGDVGNLEPLLPPAIERALLATADGCRIDPSLGALLWMLEQVASALHEAHERGVVHRDVKPSNVLLATDGRPQLVDFGLATLRAAATLTASGDLLGTPAYMAPEQIRRGSGDVDVRVDVYSLGVVMFECLTLRLPFTGASHGELLEAIRRAPPPPLRELRPDLPLGLLAVVETAMARTPDLRYRTAREFAQDLARARRGERVRSRRTPKWRLAWDWIGRNRVVTTVSLLVAVATAVIGGMAIAVRAAHREMDLLASPAVIAMAGTEEDELWPAIPEHEQRFVAWLDRFARPADDQSLAARLRRLEAVCQCSAEHALQRARVHEDASARSDIEAELAALARVTPATGAGALPAETVEEFLVHRTEWLRADLRALAPQAESTAGQPVASEFQEALLATARYLVDGAEIADRPGAVQRVRDGLRWLREVERVTIHEPATAWATVRATLASGAAPYRQPIDLEPQIGLVPLGADPDSGLQEFALPRSGSVPTRDDQGRLRCTSDSAIVLVLLPGGTVTMGTARVRIGSDALAFPAHRVTLRPFFLAKFEATQRQWRRLGGGSPSRMAEGGEFLGHRFRGDQPVENVALGEVRTVLRWHGLELPTEAQWEYAARARANGPQPASSSDRQRDNTADAVPHRPMPPFSTSDNWDGHLLPTPVGTFPANPFGLHDLGGNVSEWCDDRFGPYWFPVRPQDGRRITSWGEHGVIRGANFALNAELHHRLPLPKDMRLFVVGVRVAKRID